MQWAFMGIGLLLSGSLYPMEQSTEEKPEEKQKRIYRESIGRSDDDRAKLFEKIFEKSRLKYSLLHNNLLQKHILDPKFNYPRDY